MEWRRLVNYLFQHGLNLLLLTSSFYGVTTTITQVGLLVSLPELFSQIPFTSVILLYGGILCFFLVPVQLAIGLVAFFQYQNPSFVLLVYFQSDQKPLPDPLLDPLQSKVGFIVLVALLAGGYIAWLLYAFYGLIVIFSAFLAIPVLTPEAFIIFLQGLTVAMGIPMIGFAIFILIAALAIENRHHSP